MDDCLILILKDQLPQCEVHSHLEQILINVPDDMFAFDTRLKEVQLVDYLVRSVLLSVLHHLHHALQYGSKDHLSMRGQLVGNLLSMLVE